MDINALLSPYARNGGGAPADAPLEAAVGSYLDAIEETDRVEPADTYHYSSTHQEQPTYEEIAPRVEQSAPSTGLAGAGLESDTFDEIASFESIDEVELATIAEPVSAYAGRHRADMPADSLSPLVPVVATHRLSA